jgi:hypothetical protein
MGSGKKVQRMLEERERREADFQRRNTKVSGLSPSEMSAADMKNYRMGISASQMDSMLDFQQKGGFSKAGGAPPVDKSRQDMAWEDKMNPFATGQANPFAIKSSPIGGATPTGMQPVNSAATAGTTPPGMQPIGGAVQNPNFLGSGPNPTAVNNSLVTFKKKKI